MKPEPMPTTPSEDLEDTEEPLSEEEVAALEEALSDEEAAVWMDDLFG